MPDNSNSLFSNKKNILIISAVLVIAIGAFLRLYHFSDWLHFELDQARDARVIDWAIENGITSLPLLGPRAAGSYLRLGPVFYYFEYLGAIIFGNNPAGIASFILIFSILTIPLIYIFFKQYFSPKKSLILMGLFSVSLFFVLYSRFAWNPNVLPFFILLFLLAIIKAVDKEEKYKNLWLIIAFATLGIATQLHFLAFMILPIVLVIFLVWKRQKIKLKIWSLSIATLLILYSPVIINEMMTGWDNTSEFIKAVSGKSEESDHSLVEKGIRNYEEQSISYFMLMSGLEKGELPKITSRFEVRSLIKTKCDDDCEKGWPLGLVSLLFFSSGIYLLVKNWLKEKNERLKNFLGANLILFGVSFAVFTPLAYDLSPRFFLLAAPLPFLFFGLIMAFLEKKMGWKGQILVMVIVIFLLFSNVLKIKERFGQLAMAPTASFKIEPDRILKERDRVPLGQQLIVSEYIKEKYDQNKFPVYIDSPSFYQRSFIYNLIKLGIPSTNFDSDKKTIYANANYFLVYRTVSNYTNNIAEYEGRYNVISKKSFGTITVFNLEPKAEAINATQEDLKAEMSKPSASTGIPQRFMWNEIFQESESEVEN